MWYLLSRILRIPIRLFDQLSELSLRLSMNFLFPKALHRYVRDSGGFRVLGDIGAYAAGIGVCLISPGIYKDYKRIGCLLYRVGYYVTYQQVGTLPLLTIPSEQFMLEIIDIASNTTAEKEKPSSVLVFVHGGGWGSGRTWQYSIIAHNMGLALNANKVVLVGYPYYPEASLIQQRDAILAALHHVRDHRSELGIGTEQPVVLSGHSSGANISALALLQHYLEEEAHHEEHHPLVEMFIGLSGIYNVEKQYDHEQNRGVQDLSPLRTSIGFDHDQNFLHCSPTLLVQKRLGSSLEAGKKSYETFPFVAIIHGKDDLTVPLHSSKDFEASICALHPSNTAVYSYFPSYGHMSPMFDLLWGGASCRNETITAIKDAYEKFVDFRLQKCC